MKAVLIDGLHILCDTRDASSTYTEKVAGAVLSRVPWTEIPTHTNRDPGRKMALTAALPDIAADMHTTKWTRGFMRWCAASNVKVFICDKVLPPELIGLVLVNLCIDDVALCWDDPRELLGIIKYTCGLGPEDITVFSADGNSMGCQSAHLFYDNDRLVVLDAYQYREEDPDYA